MVVPLRAGQGADASARALARELEAVLGQPLIIENRPGGNNVIGVKALTNAAADGDTLFYGTNSVMAANAVFFRDWGYDPVKDFTPVAMFGRSRWVVVVSAESPIRSFADLVETSDWRREFRCRGHRLSACRHLAGQFFRTRCKYRPLQRHTAGDYRCHRAAGDGNHVRLRYDARPHRGRKGSSHPGLRRPAYRRDSGRSQSQGLETGHPHLV